jgi:uroporphyrinogen-III decarboxylase
MAKGIPDPMSGFMERVEKFYHYFVERKEEGFTFEDRPLGDISVPMGTDGPLTIAMNITGGAVLKLLCSDPDLFQEFLGFITDALIERMKAWHKLKGVSFPYENFTFADDSIQLLSPKVYKRFVLPLHKKIVRTFCIGRPGIHLCGDVNQHLETLRSELEIKYLDSGFPLDLAKARETLGDDVTIRGNIHVVTLLNGPKDDIRNEALRILGSGVLRGKKFIFGEGNNVAPMTPAENLNFAYEVVRRYGKLS